MTELGLQLRVETHPPGGISLELLFLSSCRGPPDNQIPLLQEVRWWSALSRVGVEDVVGTESNARGSVRPTTTGILHDKVEGLLSLDHFK